MVLDTQDTHPPRVFLAKVTFGLFLCKFNQLFTFGSQTHLGGETTQVGKFSRLGREGNPGRQDNFSSYKHFGLPNCINPLWSIGQGKLKERGISVHLTIQKIVQGPL